MNYLPACRRLISINLGLLLLPIIGYCQNPIIPASEGMTDPHIRIYEGMAYMTACHDHSIDNEWFHIDHWRMYSSPDLVNWKLEYTLQPEETYIGEAYDQCWATDFIRSNGKYYWYFSKHNHGVGVMVADSPGGPWEDPLGKALLYEGLVPTDPYDPGIVEYDGEYYIFFGVWDFYLARLNEDMISLAETPRKILINNPQGPYNQDGTNEEHPTDDKPFIHHYKGKFYLSWGCFYAMSDQLYGPYDYVDAIMNDSSFAEGYKEPTWPNGYKQGRHGSFFDMNNQWYFAYDDMSQTGTRYFRSSFISYVHYRENGEIAPIRVDGTGVGQYDANKGSIEAENYFAASQIQKTEHGPEGFRVSGIGDGDFLIFPNIHGLAGKNKLVLHARALKNLELEIRRDSPEGEILTSYRLKMPEESSDPDSFTFDFPPQEGPANLCFVFRGSGDQLLLFDSFIFQGKASDKDPAIQAAVDRTSVSHYQNYQVDIESMGLGRYGGSEYKMAFRNRDYHPEKGPTPGNREACLYIQDAFRSMGMEVSVQGTYSNVIGEIRGTGNPDKIYIIGAHYDHLEGDRPGGDDNASGTAAVLEAARVLSQYQFESTIRFICFNAEEDGLLGSKDYVSNHVLAGDEYIAGMINLDLILRPGSDVDSLSIIDAELESRSTHKASWEWARAYQKAAMDYVPALIVDETIIDGVSSSDNDSFLEAGFPAFLVIENSDPDWAEANPYIHGSEDASDRLANNPESPGGVCYDYSFAADITRTAVALIASEAIILSGPGAR